MCIYRDIYFLFVAVGGWLSWQWKRKSKLLDYHRLYVGVSRK